MTRKSRAAALVCTVLLATIASGCTGQSPTQPALTANPSSLSANSGGAASPLGVTTDTLRVRTPVTFTKSGCPDLPGLIISGSGEQLLVMNFRTNKDGVTFIERNDLVTGTATDNTGASYRFNYHNHSNVKIPPGGFPWSFVTTDHFNLVGNGQADHLAVSFVARVTFTSPTDPPQAEFVHVHGNPALCDPL